ncbi:MAG: hypothetical protein COA79_16835 [Planctomycetota bacterium]|nr:MAG: hypothetical protein COA79_16835 [Planctomycetota bacterium]
MKNLKNLTEKQTLTFTIVGAVVVCLIPFISLCYFQYESGNGFTSSFLDNPSNLSSKIVTLDNQIDVMDRIIATRSKLEIEKNSLNEIYERAKKALPETEDLEDLYQLLGEIFDRSKLKLIHLKDISPKKDTGAGGRRGKKKKATSSDNIKFVQMVYTIEGNYQEILNFIHQVEDHDFERFVMITSLKLDPKTDPKKESNLEYMRAKIMFLSFYYYTKKKGSSAK